MDNTKDEKKDSEQDTSDNEQTDFSFLDRNIEEDLMNLDMRERFQS